MLLQAGGARQRVAVIVNENARGVRRRVIDDLAELVPPHDLYVSSQPRPQPPDRRQGGRARLRHRALRRWRRHVRPVPERRGRRSAPPRPGAAVGRRPAPRHRQRARRLPRRLASDRRGARVRPRPRPPRRPRQAPAAARSRRQDDAVRRLRPRRADPRRLPRRSARSSTAWPARSRRRIGAAPRYALTVGLRSTPRFVLKQLPEIEVINTGEPVYPIYWRNGRILEDEPIATGAVVWRGRASLASCSTIPNFGLGMKMFPFAQAREGRFQLRCATASAYETLRNLPAVFRGEYRSPQPHRLPLHGDRDPHGAPGAGAGRRRPPGRPALPPPRRDVRQARPRPRLSAPRSHGVQTSAVTPTLAARSRRESRRQLWLGSDVSARRGESLTLRG